MAITRHRDEEDQQSVKSVRRMHSLTSVTSDGDFAHVGRMDYNVSVESRLINFCPLQILSLVLRFY